MIAEADSDLEMRDRAAADEPLHAECFVICTLCKCVLSSRDAKRVRVELDDDTTAPGLACGPCWAELVAHCDHCGAIVPCSRVEGMTLLCVDCIPF